MPSLNGALPMVIVLVLKQIMELVHPEVRPNFSLQRLSPLCSHSED